jgi:uncharacterized membrane protein SirB2
MLYPLHVGAVVLSGLLFLARGIGIYTRMAWVEARWVRVVPHVIDTVLLASAIGLALRIGQYPFVHGWVTAKLLALFVYIGLGMAAFRFFRGEPIGLGAFLAALLTFAYIVSVAFSRQVVTGF